MQKRI